MFVFFLILLCEDKGCVLPIKIMKRVIFPSVEDTASSLFSTLSIHIKSTFLFIWELGEVYLVFENEALFSFPHEKTQLDLLAAVGRTESSAVKHSGQASLSRDGCFPSC